MRNLSALSLGALVLLAACSTTPSVPVLPLGQGFTLGSVQADPVAHVYQVSWPSPSPAWEESVAYVVVPRGVEPGPGLVYFHLYGPGGNWSQFLEEALLGARKGVRSVLLVGRVPWDTSFDGTPEDRGLIDAQMSDLRRAVTLLERLPGVDPRRLGFVGHDYGAMYGAMLSAEPTSLGAFALVAPTPSFNDWIGYFLRTGGVPAQYDSLLGERNPGQALARKPGVPRMLQFSKNDIYIPLATARALAAADPASVVEYFETSSHAQIASDGAASRLRWLLGNWGLRSPLDDIVPTVAVDGPAGRYLLGRTEVSQAQWKAVVKSNPSWFKGDNLPVEMVNWYEAVDYCNRLSAAEGLPPAYTIEGDRVTPIPGSTGWRLPTSQEWEWAARGGELSAKTKFAGSDLADEVAWTWENSAEITHEVGTKMPNELGFFDMTGNVREWCSDPGPDETTRVYRGGGFILGERYLLIDTVDDYLAVYHNNDFGFRIARSLP